MALTGTFDSGLIAIADAANYVEVCRIQAGGRPVIVRCEVGAGGAIAHLRVSQSVHQAAGVNVLAEDADFSSPNVAIPYVLGTNVHQTAAGGSFQLRLESGAADYVIYAKKSTSDTTLKVTGVVL